MLFYQLESKQICTQHSAGYNLAVTPIWTSPFANKNNSSRLENFSNSMPKEQATSLIFISPYVIYRASLKSNILGHIMRVSIVRTHPIPELQQYHPSFIFILISSFFLNNCICRIEKNQVLKTTQHKDKRITKFAAILEQGACTVEILEVSLQIVPSHKVVYFNQKRRGDLIRTKPNSQSYKILNNMTTNSHTSKFFS